MATDPAFSLQVALVAALKAIATAAGSNVFDRVPPGDPFPRITLGPSQSVPNDADCYDGTETFQQIDVWSRSVGLPEVKRIADAIRDRLHDGDLTLSGHTLELMTVESIDYSRDPDGLTNRARISVRVLSQPST